MRYLVLFVAALMLTGCVVVPIPSAQYYSVPVVGNYPPPYPQAPQIAPQYIPQPPQPPVVYQQPAVVYQQPLFLAPAYPVYDPPLFFWFRFGGEGHRHR